jgi:hypothetical protein
VELGEVVEWLIEDGAAHPTLIRSNAAATSTTYSKRTMNRQAAIKSRRGPVQQLIASFFTIVPWQRACITDSIPPGVHFEI